MVYVNNPLETALSHKTMEFTLKTKDGIFSKKCNTFLEKLNWIEQEILPNNNKETYIVSKCGRYGLYLYHENNKWCVRISCVQKLKHLNATHEYNNYDKALTAMRTHIHTLLSNP